MFYNTGETIERNKGLIITHRGFHLDCARHFYAVDEVKKIINEAAIAGANVFHWHLTDDQGWRIESKQFPKLQAINPEYYTQNDLKAVVDFADTKGVEVIPEIELPGHTRSLLVAYPEFSCTGESVELATKGGIYDVILCPGKDSMFAFLEELLNEVCALFPGLRFHIGGDEAPKNKWHDCPDCRKRMEQEGLQDYEDLQGYFTNRVNAIIKKNGKKAICWNDSLVA
ncbi:MAG: family 20 glycosylhydrolase, partial [Spirochaetaceae bacterium]|nr:family 20 glycosylhydrolase [Spirochaetaceae bacterium]